MSEAPTHAAACCCGLYSAARLCVSPLQPCSLFCAPLTIYGSALATAAVLAFWNRPYTTRKGRRRPAHTGFVAVRARPQTDAVLLAWWHATRHKCCARYAQVTQGGSHGTHRTSPYIWDPADTPSGPHVRQGRDWDQGAFNEGVILQNSTLKSVRLVGLSRGPSV